MMSRCALLYKSGAIRLALFACVNFFFISNRSYWDATGRHCRNSVSRECNRKGKKTLVDEKPGYDKCLLCSFVDS